VTGVIERERQRQQYWADLGLPDPIKVLAEERHTRNVYGAAVTSAKRAVLDKYFRTHPAERPRNW
jgi:hypothetical protein